MKILKLVFNTADNKNFNIFVPNPKDDLTSAQVDAAMNMILSKDVFMSPTTAESLISKDKAEIIETTTTSLSLN